MGIINDFPVIGWTIWGLGAVGVLVVWLWQRRKDMGD